MPLRFRRSIRIFPGVRVNIGKHGINSTTIGKGPVKLNVGTKGAHSSVNIPGTGVTYISPNTSSNTSRYESNIKGGTSKNGSCLLIPFTTALQKRLDNNRPNYTLLKWRKV